MNKWIILFLTVAVIGAGFGVYAYNVSNNQDDLNFNSPETPLLYDDWEANDTIPYLEGNSDYYIIDSDVIDCLNQYFQVVDLEVDKNGTVFNEFKNSSFNMSNHTFYVPNGTNSTEKFKTVLDNFNFSEIYRVSTGATFGVILISNPDFNGSELVNNLTNGTNITFQEYNLTKINSSEGNASFNFTVYKFQLKDLYYYIYDDGDDIIIIVIDTDDDDLLAFIANSSSDGKIDKFNPYYNLISLNTDSTNKSQSDDSDDIIPNMEPEPPQ